MIKVFMSYGMNGKSEKEQKDSRRKLRIKVKDYFQTNARDKYVEIWQVRHPDRTVPGRTGYTLRYEDPMKVVKIIDNSKAVTDGGRLSYLGLAIQKLDECDAIIFDDDWMEHKGCRIEHEVAKLYGLKIIEA